MRLRTSLANLLQSHSALSLSPGKPAQRLPATTRRTQSTTRGPSTPAATRSSSVIPEKKLFTPMQTVGTFRSSTLFAAHSVLQHLRTLQEPLPRRKKTEAVCRILQLLAEEEGFYHKAMQVMTTQLDEDLFCSLHTLSGEALEEFQTYDEDLERQTDKVPYYAIVSALESALQKLREELADRTYCHQTEVSRLNQQVLVQRQEIATLKEAVLELERKPASYEEVYRKLEKDHHKLNAEFQKVRTSAFKRKMKNQKLKAEVMHQKEVSAELKTQFDWLTREVTQLTNEKERREAKLAALRETGLKREALFKEAAKKYEALKNELAQSQTQSASLKAELETLHRDKDTEMTPRPDWSLCPWKLEESEHKSSRQLLEELVKTIESRPKLFRKKSMKSER